jgi:hypothetical protein
VLFALAYALIAHAIRKGGGWPRPVSTILAIFSLPAILLGPIAVAIVLTGLIAVTAIWMPSARRYAIESKRIRRSARQ